MHPTTSWRHYGQDLKAFWLALSDCGVFQGGQPWPVRWSAPGIMGWYAWLPWMECYHGVLSFDHSISGALEVEGQGHIFDGGRGYIERDWGKAFPAGYIWFQSNHFDTPGSA